MASEHSLTVGNCVLDYDAMSVAVDGGAAGNYTANGVQIAF